MFIFWVQPRLLLRDWYWQGSKAKSVRVFLGGRTCIEYKTVAKRDGTPGPSFGTLAISHCPCLMYLLGEQRVASRMGLISNESPYTAFFSSWQTIYKWLRWLRSVSNFTIHLSNRNDMQCFQHRLHVSSVVPSEPSALSNARRLPRHGRFARITNASDVLEGTQTSSPRMQLGRAPCHPAAQTFRWPKPSPSRRCLRPPSCSRACKVLDSWLDSRRARIPQRGDGDPGILRIEF